VRRSRWNDGAEGHPSEASLLAFLDGQLDRSTRRAVERHVRECWHCGAVQRALLRDIDVFLAARRALIASLDENRDDALFALRRRLRESVPRTRSDASTSVTRWSAWWIDLWTPRLRQQFSVGVVAAIVLVASLVAFDRPLSAIAVLEASEAADEWWRTPPLGDVLHSVVVVEQFDGGGTRTLHTVELESIRTGGERVAAVVRQAHGATTRMTDRPSGDLTAALLPALDMPASLQAFVRERGWLPEVSATEYRKLVQGASALTRSRRHNGHILVSAAFGPGAHPLGIERVEIAIDARTFAARRVSLFEVGGGIRREHRVTPRLVRLIGAGSVTARSFLEAAPAPAESAVLPLAELPPVHRAASAPRVLRFEDTAASPLEIDIAWTLRRVAADLADEVNVFPMSDGTLLVQGLIDDERRAADARAALDGVGRGVRVDLLTPRDLERGGRELFPSRRNQPSPATATPDAPVAWRAAIGLTMPMRQRLEAHIGRQSGGDPSVVASRIAAIATQAVDAVDHALFHAWARDRLGEQFTASRVEALPTRQRDRLGDLRAEHTAAIARNLRRLCDLFAALEQDAACLAGVDDGSIEDAGALSAPLLDVNRLTRLLLTASDVSIDAEATYRRLMRAIASLGSPSPAPGVPH